MEPRPRQALIFSDAQGRRPFEAWLASIKDGKARAVIKARIARLEAGNLGDCESLGDGMMEPRIHLGPGFRVYFAEWGRRSLLLLSGGTKRGQRRDIVKARAFWKVAREES